jgi:hypothetical protein
MKRQCLGVSGDKCCQAAALLLVLASLAGGCARSATSSPSGAHLEGWSFAGQPAQAVSTPHYRIHSTLESDDFLIGLARVMEGALVRYHQLAPEIALSQHPMDCYVFARRSEWARFTARHTGDDAAIYLQISRGGYTIGDWYVAYYIGDGGTWSVAAHEGWHQFVARHFKGRLPPFIEEGAACTFENIRWVRGEPVFDTAVHAGRQQALRQAIERKDLWPLEELIQMHAGDVVQQPAERIEAFYSQSWAFVRFLWEAEQGRFRPALQRLMNETAAGTVFDPTGSHRSSQRPWNPAAVRAILEHYLEMNLPQIDRHYQRYIRRLAGV